MEKVVALPGSARPEDAVCYLSAEVANGTIDGVVTIAITKNALIDVRCFGKLMRRELIFALAQLHHSVMQEEE